MKIGIVILNYKTKELTIDLVMRCCSINAIDEIVVIDNCSQDDIGTLIYNQFKNRVVFLDSKKNLGYAKGNNIGLKKLVELGCDICIVANPDVLFDENLILAVKTEFLKNDKYGILTTARTMEDDNLKIRQYWSLPKLKELVFENFLFYSKFIKSKKEIYDISASVVTDIGVAPGAFFAIRSNLLRSIHYLDPNTFLYFEENCLAAKISNTGYKIGIIPYVKYVCLDRNKNSTSKIQQSTFGRKCYCASKEYYAKKYLGSNTIELFVLKITDSIFIFEKWVSIKITHLLRRRKR